MSQKKTSENLLRELTVLIEEEEEKRLKERESTLPNTLNGEKKKKKKKLKDDATDIVEWYNTFEWDKADIAEDILNSDTRIPPLQPLALY